MASQAVQIDPTFFFSSTSDTDNYNTTFDSLYATTHLFMVTYVTVVFVDNLQFLVKTGKAMVRKILSSSQILSETSLGELLVHVVVFILQYMLT